MTSRKITNKTLPYLSLDEAREELARRWQNEELKKKVMQQLGPHFMPEFAAKPRGVLFRQLCNADNGFLFFLYCSKYVGADPLILEYLDDIFVHFNEEKKGLGRLRVSLEDGTPALVDVMNFHDNEKKKLGDVVMKTGKRLAEFYHGLFNLLKFRVDFFENSRWFKSIGKASDYYYFLLLHFIAHGFLFETYLIQDNFTRQEDYENERGFDNSVIIPTLERIYDDFGLYPLIVRSYPANQSAEEDFFWWCYPPHVNDYIVEYARKHKLTFRPWQAE